MQIDIDQLFNVFINVAPLSGAIDGTCKLCCFDPSSKPILCATIHTVIADEDQNDLIMKALRDQKAVKLIWDFAGEKYIAIGKITELVVEWDWSKFVQKAKISFVEGHRSQEN